jgi:chromatin remodeling complex protein RSC6
LYDKADKRKIIADDKLSALLTLEGLPPPTNLTYFNLQTHMKHHFLKDTVASPSSSEPATTTEIAA